MLWFRVYSFTSLKADLQQDINRGFAISRCLNVTFPWRKCSVRALVSCWLRGEDLYLLLFSFGLMYQCLNRAIPLRKCSIKAPAKWINSVYVLTDISHQRSKWLSLNQVVVFSICIKANCTCSIRQHCAMKSLITTYSSRSFWVPCSKSKKI